MRIKSIYVSMLPLVTEDRQHFALDRKVPHPHPCIKPQIQRFNTKQLSSFDRKLKPMNWLASPSPAVSYTFIIFSFLSPPWTSMPASCMGLLPIYPLKYWWWEQTMPPMWPSSSSWCSWFCCALNTAYVPKHSCLSRGAWKQDRHSTDSIWLPFKLRTTRRGKWIWASSFTKDGLSFQSTWILAYSSAIILLAIPTSFSPPSHLPSSTLHPTPTNILPIITTGPLYLFSCALFIILYLLLFFQANHK